MCVLWNLIVKWLYVELIAQKLTSRQSYDLVAWYTCIHKVFGLHMQDYLMHTSIQYFFE